MIPNKTDNQELFRAYPGQYTERFFNHGDITSFLLSKGIFAFLDLCQLSMYFPGFKEFIWRLGAFGSCFGLVEFELETPLLSVAETFCFGFTLFCSGVAKLLHQFALWTCSCLTKHFCVRNSVNVVNWLGKFDPRTCSCLKRHVGVVNSADVAYWLRFWICLCAPKLTGVVNLVIPGTSLCFANLSFVIGDSFSTFIGFPRLMVLRVLLVSRRLMVSRLCPISRPWLIPWTLLVRLSWPF